MKKYYFLFILVTALSSVSHGNTFIIKLASFSNHENLTEKIATLAPHLQKNVHIIKDNNLSKAFVASYKTKKNAQDDLEKYQKIFSDAYITTLKRQNVTLIPQHTVPNVPQPIQKIDHTTQIINPIEPQNNNRISLKEIIEGKTLYLCPNTISSNKQKLLIRADFKNHILTYTTLLGNVPSLQMQYIIQNERLYFGRNGQFNPSQYSKVEEQYFEYYLVSKYTKGSIIHQMRYYKNLENAKAYLKSLSSER